MNNEIKEILDNLKKTADNTIFVVCGSQEELDKAPKYTANFLSINDRQAKVLLNYITNLQEENKSFKKHWVNLIGENLLMNEIQNLQQRIDKAIEIYKECCKTQDFSTCDLDMYEALQGSEKK